ncbi:ribonuclease H-like domain-containing protein [Tanacetum coccineum]
MAEQDSHPPTITAMKIPIIKKGEYDIWSMRMRQYICHTDHNLWDIIVDGDLQEEAAQQDNYLVLSAPKTAPNNWQPNRNLERIDQDDLEELDNRWQVAMLTVRVQRFILNTGRNLDFKGKHPVTFDKSKVKCYNYHKKGHFAKECKSGRNQGKRSYGDNGRRNATTNEPSSQALVAQDGLGGYD